MMLFVIHALLLSIFLQSACAVPDVRPTLTAVYGEGGQAIQGISPRPTDNPSDPRRLFRRAVPDDVCGYVSANICEIDLEGDGVSGANDMFRHAIYMLQ